MKHLLTAIWWWIRVTILVIVGVYAFLIFWKNSGQSALIWYWPGQPAEQTNIMALTLAALVSGFLIGVIGLAFFKTMVNLRRTRAARRRRAIEQHREEIERKAGMLRVKPAPEPTIRPRPKPVESLPSPAVEPMPEPTLAPAMVVTKPPEAIKPPESKPVEAVFADASPGPPSGAPVAIDGKPAATETKPVVAEAIRSDLEALPPGSR